MEGSFRWFELRSSTIASDGPASCRAMRRDRERDLGEHLGSAPMQESDETPRVKPIRAEPDAATSGAARRGRKQRMALVGVPVVAVAILMLVFGSGGGNVQETPPTSIPENALTSVTTAAPPATTTTTLPPTMGRLAPEIAGRLAVVATQPIPRLLIWEQDDEVPRAFSIRVGMQDVSFDASGEYLVYLSGGALIVDRIPGNGGRSLGEAPTAAIWHPTRPQMLAYTLAGSESVTLTVARVLEDGGIETNSVGDLPAGSRLVAWGEWGYAIEEPLPGDVDAAERIVVIYGFAYMEPLRAVPGAVITANGDLLLVAGVADPEAAIAAAAAAGIAPRITRPMQGNALLDSELLSVTLELLGDPVDLPSVTIARDGSRVAVSTRTASGGTSVTLFERRGTTSIVVPLRGEAMPIGFIANARYLTLHDPGTSELILLDTRAGTRVRLPSGAGEIVAANARAANG
jgi:hypothetical protein